MDTFYSTIIGAIVGGTFVLIGTFYTLRHNNKRSKESMRLGLLNDKRQKIEGVLAHCQFFYENDDIEFYKDEIHKEYNHINDFMRLNRHYYLSDSDFAKIYRLLYDDYYFENELHCLYQEQKVIMAFRPFIQNDIEKTMKEISELTS